jgi:hypothetical protein
MNEQLQRTCRTCGATGEDTPLERCKMCHRFSCLECAHRSMGQRFCSENCSIDYIYGDSGDEDDPDAADIG